MFSRKNQSVLVIAIAVLIVGALVLSLVGTIGGGAASDDREAQEPAEQTLNAIPEDDAIHELARRDADDPLAMGEADAPVLIIQYADFQTAASASFARDTLPTLIEEYVEKGVLRIEFRNYPIYGPESDSAARGAWAAGEQDRFWEFYELAFAEDAHQHSGRYSEEAVVEFAEEAGVPDLEQFEEDRSSEEAGEAVEADANEAFTLDIPSSPAFLINGHPMIGARPLEEFRTVIDQLHELEAQN